MATSNASPSIPEDRDDVSAELPVGNGGQRDMASTSSEKTVPEKALIVCERWGSSIEGGVTDALHLVIRLLQNRGITVYCTALYASKQENKHARQLGVKLLLPIKEGIMQFRKPNRDWLHGYHLYYPHILGLTNVKYVFSFGIITSNAAKAMVRKNFSSASFYIINVFGRDSITPVIVGCSKEELDFRREVLEADMLRTKAILSIGHSIFHEYRRRYPDNTHREASHVIDESYFGLTCDATFHKGKEVFQILSIIQDYEIDDITKDSTVVRAIAKVAEYWHELQETPPVWKIIGVSPGKENELKARLEENSRLKVIPSSRRSAEELDKELRSSHLVLVLPSTTNYVNLTLAAMCAAIPVIYPQESQSYEFASDHIHPLREHTLGVDMESDPEILVTKIVRVMQKNKTAVEHAKRIKHKIKNVVVRALQNINERCLSDESDSKSDHDSITSDDSSPENSNTDTGKNKCVSEDITNNKDTDSDEKTRGRIQQEQAESQASSSVQEERAVEMSMEGSDKLSSVSRKRKQHKTPRHSQRKAAHEKTECPGEFKKQSYVSPRHSKKFTMKSKRRELQAAENLRPSMEGGHNQVSVPNKYHNNMTSSKISFTRCIPFVQIVSVLVAIIAVISPFLVGFVNGILLALFLAAVPLYIYQFHRASSNVQEERGVEMSMEGSDKLSSLSRKRKRHQTPRHSQRKAADEKTTWTCESKKPSYVSPRQSKKFTIKRKRRELQATGKKVSKDFSKSTPLTATAFPLFKKRRKERKPETNKEPETGIYSKLWTMKNKEKRVQGELAIRTRINRIVPKENNTIEEVDASFYSLKRTKDNTKLVEKQLNHRYKTMKVKRTECNSISYIMDCKSQEDLESFMEDYSSGRLHRMTESTFLCNELLSEIGAIYISLETSIDYEEYLLCEEELAHMADENVHQFDSRDQNTTAGHSCTWLADFQQMSNEDIVELNKKVQAEINKAKICNDVLKQSTGKAATHNTILKGMSRQQDEATELQSLLDDIIAMKGKLQRMKKSHNYLICDFNELFRNAGAIIIEADISMAMKQNLMMTFETFVPPGSMKAGDPDAKLVIDGDIFMEYVENTVHDVKISVESKQEIIEQFRDFVDAKVGTTAIVTSLAAQQEESRARIKLIEELIDLQHQLRNIERGQPLKDTIRSLSRSCEKQEEVSDPRGLTINKNGHVVVSDYGDTYSDQPGSVKTVTVDTAQILTSVTVHGLPHRFRPTDTKMADNGDYYTADDVNKCIVVSDAKSRVKQMIAMGKLKGPTGVFVDKDRNVFIADYEADCVIKCNGDGDIILSQQLSKPWSLTMNSKYQLIVSCRGDENCIYVLDSIFEILNYFGSSHLVDPCGVTVDNADNIYVADEGKIVKFDKQGEYQETVTVDVNPYDIAVFEDGRIVCSDDTDSTVRIIYK